VLPPIRNFFVKKIKPNPILALWAILPLFFLVTDFIKDRYNNYKIFRQVFYHLIEKLPIYSAYPNEYHDVNHYGPLFGILVAPFSVFPDIVGVTLWNLFNALFLYYAIVKSIKSPERIKLVLFLCTIEMANAMWSCQFNSSVAAMILLSYHFTKKEEEFKAAFFIMLGFYIKIYGIVGLAFFLLSKNRLRFTKGVIFWGSVLFILPMIITNPQYIIQSYLDWFHSLEGKNIQNIGLHSDQDISVPGFIRRIFNLESSSPLPIVLAGAIATAIPFVLRVNRQKDEHQLQLCGLLLMFPVLFSSGSEHPTFIIAMTGASIWLSRDNHINKREWALIIPFLLLFSGLGPTDLFGKKIRYVMSSYSLKVVPFFILWLTMFYALVFKRNKILVNE